LLPDEINLKNPAMASLYSTASTEINGKEPGKKDIVKGEPMIYGITMLNNAPNRPAAIAFLKFLLTADRGMKIMEKNGQPSVIPMQTANYEQVPAELKPFVKK
jgi:molybdate/tungstate transport system substrate-binding protein